MEEKLRKHIEALMVEIKEAQQHMQKGNQEELARVINKLALAKAPEEAKPSEIDWEKEVKNVEELGRKAIEALKEMIPINGRASLNMYFDDCDRVIRGYDGNLYLPTPSVMTPLEGLSESDVIYILISVQAEKLKQGRSGSSSLQLLDRFFKDVPKDELDELVKSIDAMETEGVTLKQYKQHLKKISKSK